MNAHLRFQKPVRRNGKSYCRGKLVIRFSYSREEGVGCYLITRGLEAFFVPAGKHEWQAEPVAKVERDAEKPGDRHKNYLKSHGWLQTSAAEQRSLAKLYAILRKDWDQRVRQHKEVNQ